MKPTKKYMFFILLSFLFCVSLFSKADAHIKELPLLGRVLFVDPGHGGIG